MAPATKEKPKALTPEEQLAAAIYYAKLAITGTEAAIKEEEARLNGPRFAYNHTPEEPKPLPCLMEMQVSFKAEALGKPNKILPAKDYKPGPTLSADSIKAAQGQLDGKIKASKDAIAHLKQTLVKQKEHLVELTKGAK